jgi:hypothetical protein
LSEEGGLGISLLERFLGFLILIAGAVSLYYVLTSLQDLAGYGGLLGFLNVVLIVVGLLLLTAKTE